jgi:hypothetical protein
VFVPSDLVSNDDVPNLYMHGPSPLRRPPAHAAAALLAGSDDEVPITRVTHHSTLVSRNRENEDFILLPKLSGLHSTSTPFFCPTGWWPWAMPSRLPLLSIYFFSSNPTQPPQSQLNKRTRCWIHWIPNMARFPVYALLPPP